MRHVLHHNASWRLFVMCCKRLRKITHGKNNSICWRVLNHVAYLIGCYESCWQMCMGFYYLGAFNVGRWVSPLPILSVAEGSALAR